ncbi:MAG: hypothetical protein F9K23_08420 [Bacteroidetes bacterium]|nr:MAG: hypothetical protein F9K23_08420 [Bacteroidota bacterium]
MNKLQTYFTYSHKSLPHSLRDRLARAGGVESLTDLDFDTKVMNEEIRFVPPITQELNNYKSIYKKP